MGFSVHMLWQDYSRLCNPLPLQVSFPFSTFFIFPFPKCVAMWFSPPSAMPQASSSRLSSHGMTSPGWVGQGGCGQTCLGFATSVIFRVPFAGAHCLYKIIHLSLTIWGGLPWLAGGSGDRNKRRRVTGSLTPPGKDCYPTAKTSDASLPPRVSLLPFLAPLPLQAANPHVWFAVHVATQLHLFPKTSPRTAHTDSSFWDGFLTPLLSPFRTGNCGWELLLRTP